VGAWQFCAVGGRYSGRGKTILGKSIEICKTNKNIKQIFKNCGRDSFVLLVDVKVGVAKRFMEIDGNLQN